MSKSHATVKMATVVDDAKCVHQAMREIPVNLVISANLVSISTLGQIYSLLDGGRLDHKRVKYTVVNSASYRKC